MSVWLVTGGAGFIGSNFVLSSLARDPGLRIINVDKLTYAGNPENLASLAHDARHELVHGDVCDRSLLTNLLRQRRPNAIVHFAAESHVDRSIDGPSEFVRTNIVGTFELLEAARAYASTLESAEKSNFRFLHISTDEVYGSLAHPGRFSEASAFAPNSPYAASKAGADHLVRAYHRTYGLPTLITNCSNNYGPMQFPEKLIPLSVLNAIDGKDLPVYGDGQNVRDWLFVHDHCDALRLVLERGAPGETYNVGGNCERANVDLVHTICDLLHELRPATENRALAARGYSSYRQLVKFVPDRPGHDRRYAIDAAKIKTALGWSPQRNLEDALRATIGWYLENRTWCANVAGKYARQRLGLSQAGQS